MDLYADQTQGWGKKATLPHPKQKRKEIFRFFSLLILYHLKINKKWSLEKSHKTFSFRSQHIYSINKMGKIYTHLEICFKILSISPIVCAFPSEFKRHDFAYIWAFNSRRPLIDKSTIERRIQHRLQSTHRCRNHCIHFWHFISLGVK